MDRVVRAFDGLADTEVCLSTGGDLVCRTRMSDMPDLAWADIDATAAFALGGDALDWLRGRRRQSGLVVWADGSTALFGCGS